MPNLTAPRTMVHNGDLRTARLRGAPAFHRWRTQGIPATVDNRIAHNHQANHVLLFIAFPAQPAIADYITELAACPHCAAVVDVFSPITRPDAMTGGPGVMTFWLDPAHRNTALRAIRAADVVTTPWPKWDGVPDWIDELSALNPNVMILPDLDRIPVEVFGATLEEAWRLGLDRKRPNS